MELDKYGTEGPCVVLIHGIPGSPDVWTEVAKSLMDRHRVLVPALLGFGAEDSPSGLDARAQARSLGRSLQEAGIARATIVGHDFGGPIALSLYELQPDVFQGLGLLATNAFPDTPIPFPLSMVNWPLIGDAMARGLFSGPALRMMLKVYGGSELGNARAVRAIFKDSLQNLPERYGHFPAILRTIAVPSLVVWGDKDPFFPIENGRRIADELENAEFEVIDNTGHFLPEQAPLEVASAIARLVTRTMSSATAR